MPLFTLQSKKVKLVFGEILAKYQAYSLTFWRNFAHLCHFSLYNRKKSNWFLVKFRQNIKPIALCYFLAKIGLFLPLFTLQSKEVKLIFGEISAKYQAYSLTFWQKLANFCHFSLYYQRKSNGFLVKFRQNSNLIALLFGENGLIFATFDSTMKGSQMDFWRNFGKIPSLGLFLPKIFQFSLYNRNEVKLSFGQISAKCEAYSLTFLQKWANFCHFLLYNQKKWNRFLVKFRQNTKLIALIFGENGLNVTKLYDQKKSNWLLVKFRQNTKPLALLFGENWPIYNHFSLYNQRKSNWIFGKILAKY